MSAKLLPYGNNGQPRPAPASLVPGQQREAVARFLCDVAYGPRDDGKHWFDHLITEGQEKFRGHADELLALLAATRDGGQA
jgi:hypothetical protein